jgi:hypothetical protein
MLWWLPRRRARIIHIDAEAESLIGDLGALAYDEARRREIEASSDAIARDWHRVAQAIARKTGAGLGTSVQAPPKKADFAPAPESGAPKETPPDSELGPLDQLNSGFAVTPAQFRVQFIRTADGSQQSTLKEVGLQAKDMPAAIVAAASLAFPPMTNGLRIIDRDGRVVFARQKKKTGRSLRLVS